MTTYTLSTGNTVIDELIYRGQASEKEWEYLDNLLGEVITLDLSPDELEEVGYVCEHRLENSY